MSVDSERVRAFMTVDLEDYRRHELRDHLRSSEPAHPAEVSRQAERLLDLFDTLHLSATFFAVGRLAGELPSSTWGRIVERHDLGCHGYEHRRVREQGPDALREELRRAKGELENIGGVDVSAFRAPYFDCEGCQPWFGEALAETGFRVDSSMRLTGPRYDLNKGTRPLEGASGQVTEVPFPSFGVGPKRITVIGGSYLRLLPLGLIRRLLSRARASGFVPMVYIHPYDLDPDAERLGYPRLGYGTKRVGEELRRLGRGGLSAKLEALSREYDFQAIRVN
jgi:peptidoglycan/xylan/chitin deacetylase (PgdA/CDA1 family)